MTNEGFGTNLFYYFPIFYFQTGQPPIPKGEGILGGYGVVSLRRRRSDRTALSRPAQGPAGLSAARRSSARLVVCFIRARDKERTKQGSNIYTWAD